MSTTDYSVVYDKPCPCGAGRITITKCSPDHQYARESQTWYEESLDCGICRKKCEILRIDENDSRFIVLRQCSDNSTINLIEIDRFCR